MESLDLTVQPPRSPYQKMEGLYMMPRTIDKMRAQLSGGKTGVHKIEGIGAGFVVPLWDPSIADEIAAVSTEDAMAMARRLARSDAVFAGTSTGANLVAAIEIGKRMGKDATVVTVMCDSGIKYLSTRLYDAVGP